MTEMTLSIDLAWIAILVYWFIKGRKTRQTQSKEPSASRFLMIAILTAGFILLFSGWTGIGPLGHRFLPNKRGIAVFGVALTWLGVLLALWARHHLAENWSARVTIKQGHELIRTGPYARLRHPIYTGLLLAAVGTAVAIGEWHSLVGICCVMIGYSAKAKREEAMLTAQFGAAFQEHRKHTGFLLPKMF